jgi:hypothetical protein
MMRKLILAGLVSMLAILISFTSCRDFHGSGTENPFRDFVDKPVSINWHGDASDGLQSYQADVKIYAQNNRTDINPRLDSSYHLSIKSINDTLYARLDFDATATTAAHSALTDGKELIIFDPATESIIYRLPMEAEESPLNRLFAGETTLTRINLAMIREEANRLSLNMIDNGKGELLLDLPSNLFPQNPLENVISRRVSFNLALETLSQIEVIAHLDDGTVETTTRTLLYELNNNVPIKVGMLTVTDSKAPSLIEGFNEDREIFNSIDEIPLMDKDMYEQLKDSGNVVDIHDFRLGDPADLSYTETIFELYQDIEINNTPDNLFRLMFN